ncbi:hypothetical protein CYLTODRAFT_415758 [Cylindrobasidium torrendii FP15055 ss-10]|uniref:SUN domain-containing protein n=1 Tax=Cylindrobasidium torrendii FP15055 ss-10 TaxID=1314674 RepID=A0A0D7AT30_9AGAR|nr:hypothetical protein CYLTODRAFT_415758 [Cylindrobasidium torrendii FP15055 ss-10]
MAGPDLKLAEAHAAFAWAPPRRHPSQPRVRSPSSVSAAPQVTLASPQQIITQPAFRVAVCIVLVSLTFCYGLQHLLSDFYPPLSSPQRQSSVNDYENAGVARNFALQTEGAQVVHALTTNTLGLDSNPSFLDRALFEFFGVAPITLHTTTPSVAVLQNATDREEQCWAFSGSIGHIAIRLPGPVNLVVHRESQTFRGSITQKDISVRIFIPYEARMSQR